LLTVCRSLALLLALIGALASVSSIAQTVNAKSGKDLHYLLVRRAGEAGVLKNYYELTRAAHFLEPQHFSAEMISHYKPSPPYTGFDIETDHSICYGVYQAWKIRVITTSDSENAPSSAKDGVYVLMYTGQPDWIFCARKYHIVLAKDGGRSITYTDFQDGLEYTIELTKNWRRIINLAAGRLCLRGLLQ